MRVAPAIFIGGTHDLRSLDAAALLHGRREPSRSAATREALAAASAAVGIAAPSRRGTAEAPVRRAAAPALRAHRPGDRGPAAGAAADVASGDRRLIALAQRVPSAAAPRSA